MKRILLILCLALSAGLVSHAVPVPIPRYSDLASLTNTLASQLKASIATTNAITASPYTYYLADPQWGLAGDGTTDDQAAWRNLMLTIAANAAEKTVVGKPGATYFMGLKSSLSNVPLCSNLRLILEGVRFALPTSLQTAGKTNTDNPLFQVFTGQDITNLYVRGGTITGYGFDLFANDITTNLWQPTNGVAWFRLTSTAGNGNNNITFDGLKAYWLAGPAVAIEGIGDLNNTPATTTYSGNITIQNCTFDHCGAPLADYGRMANWIELYPTNITAGQYAFARSNIIQRALIGAVTMTSGSTLVAFDNSTGKIAASPDSTGKYCVAFYGTNLPSNIYFGYPYFVQSTSSSGITISSTYGGAAITFASSSGDVGMFYGIGSDSPFGIDGQYSFLNTKTRADWVFQPAFDGAWQVSYATNVNILNNVWSALGDSSELNAVIGCVMRGNTIQSAVMGGLFIGPQCRNVTFSGNTTDMGSGSRVITVETGSYDVAITGNTFKGGGRGVQINTVNHFTIANNTFIDSTLKGIQVAGLGTWVNHPNSGWQGQQVFNLFSAGIMTNVVIAGNIIHAANVRQVFNLSSHIYDLHINGNTIIPDYGSPGANQVNKQTYAQGVAGFVVPKLLFNANLTGNPGIETSAEDVFTTTIYTSTTNLIIPHKIPPTTWVNQSAYGGVNYAVQLTGNFGGAYVVTNSADMTNIYIGLSAPVITNMPISVNYRIKSFPASSTGVFASATDPDAVDYFQRVFRSGGSLSAASMSAYNAFVAGLKSDGNWTHCVALYPLDGGWNAFHQALKVPQDLARWVTWTGIAPTNISSRGVYFDGVTSFLYTPINPSDSSHYGSASSVLVGGLSVFLNDTVAPTQINSTPIPIGIFDGTSRYQLSLSGNQRLGYWGGSVPAANNPGSFPLGEYIHIQRTNSTLLNLWRYGSGSLITSNGVTTSVTPASTTWNFAIGARANAGALSNPYTGIIAFAGIFDGSELPGSFYTRLNTLLTATSRIP